MGSSTITMLAAGGDGIVVVSWEGRGTMFAGGDSSRKGQDGGKGCKLYNCVKRGLETEKSSSNDLVRERRKELTMLNTIWRVK